MVRSRAHWQEADSRRSRGQEVRHDKRATRSRNRVEGPIPEEGVVLPMEIDPT